MLEAKPMHGFASERFDWPFILSDISQTNKDSGNTRPRERTRSK
jgi:hypothetical protein